MTTTNTKHRWFQFRLAGLFALTFAVSVPLAIHAYRERQYRLRVAAAEVIAATSDCVFLEQPDDDPGPGRSICSSNAVLLRGDAARQACIASPSDEELSALTFFPELKILTCWDSISDSQLAEVSKLPSLEQLKLRKTGIGDEGVRHLGRLRMMRTLDLSGNSKITGATMQCLAPMQQLEELDLSGTSVDDEGARRLSALQSLRVLSLSGARLTDAGVRRLCSLKQLRSLTLDGNDISDDALAGLARLPRLTRLGLGSTRVTDMGLSTLARSDSILDVSVSGCAVSDVGLVSLARMKCLRLVWASNTSVTAKGIAELRRLKPKAGPLDEDSLALYVEWGLDPGKCQDKEIEVHWDDPAEKHDNEGETQQAGAAGGGFF